MGIIKDAVTTALIIAAPFLIVTAGIGLVVAVVQAATQIQEQSIAFIVKIVAVGLILILLGSWLITGMASLRMMKKVKTSDVVIRNPTHYAVALKYKPPKDKAPIVVAKGRDLVALKIIDIAKENSVHITENRPLARGIYESVELDRPIPEEFYKAVAEILAFIFKLNKEKSKGGGSK